MFINNLGMPNPLLYYGYYQAFQQKLMEQFASQAAAVAAAGQPDERKFTPDNSKLLMTTPPSHSSPFHHILPSNEANKRNVSKVFLGQIRGSLRP